MRIRKATPEDAQTVSRIVCLCYEGFGQTDHFSHDVIVELKKSRGSTKCIRELIANEDVFVADDEGRIQGMVSVKDNEITKLYIDPRCQRKGVEKQLFTHAESLMRSRGYPDMFLGAAAPSAVPFYERMGMRIARKRAITCGPCIGMTSIVLKKTFGAEQGAAGEGDKPRR